MAICETHEEAELAAKELQEAGIVRKTLSIAGKDTHADEQVIGFSNVGDRMKRWNGICAFQGGFWGLLFCSAFLQSRVLVPSLAIACPRASGWWQGHVMDGSNEWAVRSTARDFSELTAEFLANADS